MTKVLEMALDLGPPADTELEADFLSVVLTESSPTRFQVMVSNLDPLAFWRLSHRVLCFKLRRTPPPPPTSYSNNDYQTWILDLAITLTEQSPQVARWSWYLCDLIHRIMRIDLGFDWQAAIVRINCMAAARPLWFASEHVLGQLSGLRTAFDPRRQLAKAKACLRGR